MVTAESIRTSKAFIERKAKIEAGVHDLDLWLHNLISNGLADPQVKSYSFWDDKAARLIDAQAPGLARWLHTLGSFPARSGEWMPGLLGELGLLYLALEAFKRFDSLGEGRQADLRTVIGWHLKREEADPADSIRDTWQVIGQRFGDEGQKLRSQRLWLIGQQSRQNALILEFAYGDAPFETRLTVGTQINAELTFFPDANRLRAFLRETFSEGKPIIALAGLPLTAALDAYCTALVAQPLARSISNGADRCDSGALQRRLGVARYGRRLFAVVPEFSASVVTAGIKR